MPTKDPRDSAPTGNGLNLIGSTIRPAKGLARGENARQCPVVTVNFGKKPHETPTEKDTETPTKAHGLPRGIRVEVLDDGRKLKARLFVGGKLRESFETEAEAVEAGREVAAQEKEHGTQTRSIVIREWQRYQEAKRLYWGGQEPDWHALGAVKLAPASMPLPEAIEAYIAIRQTANLAEATRRQMKTKLRVFTAAFNGKRVADVTSASLREWMAQLSANGFEARTVRDYLKYVTTFFTYARRERWIAEDPCEAVDAPKIVADKINILTVEEAARLFEKNRDARCVARLALEAFGGLRCSSAGRLVKADIKWEDAGIELPGKKHKSGRRHFIDGLPENLWAWLDRAPAECWEMTERQYMKEKGDAFIRAGVTSTHNCLRHSFPTYHVALHKNAALTAILMQHTNATTLFRHYKGNATHKAGVDYFKILP